MKHYNLVRFADDMYGVMDVTRTAAEGKRFFVRLDNAKKSCSAPGDIRAHCKGPEKKARAVKDSLDFDDLCFEVIE